MEFDGDPSARWGEPTVTVSVDLTAPPFPKTADDLYFATERDHAFKIKVLASFANPGAYAVALTSANTASCGTAAVNPNGTIAYTPDAGTTATGDQFCYTISDGHGGVATGTIAVALGH